MNSGETVTFHGAGYINHLMVENCRQMMRLAPKEVTLFHSYPLGGWRCLLQMQSRGLQACTESIPIKTWVSRWLSLLTEGHGQGKLSLPKDEQLCFFLHFCCFLSMNLNKPSRNAAPLRETVWVSSSSSSSERKLFHCWLDMTAGLCSVAVARSQGSPATKPEYSRGEETKNIKVQLSCQEREDR